MNCEYYRCEKEAEYYILFWGNSRSIGKYCNEHAKKIMNIVGCPHKMKKIRS